MSGFVPFRAVELHGDELVVVDDARPAFTRGLRQVLDFYAVPWRPGPEGTVLVPAAVAADRDTCWNYTSKARDGDWLADHA